MTTSNRTEASLADRPDRSNEVIDKDREPILVDEQLAVLKNQLEQTATALDERTRELAAVSQTLSEFSYSISHDLRAPPRHIQSFTELLSEHLHDGLDSQSRHYLDVIAGSATAMRQLIDQLLVRYQKGDICNR